jgi:hypothetical protein
LLGYFRLALFDGTGIASFGARVKEQPQSKGMESYFENLHTQVLSLKHQAPTSVARGFLTDDARRPVLIDNVRLFDADAGRLPVYSVCLAL